MSSTEGKSATADAVQQVRAVAGAVVDDVAAGRWRRVGLVGVSLGVVAVGAAAGIAAERLTLGREMRRRAEAEVEAAAPFGSLRGIPCKVAAPDGTELYVELDGTGWKGSAQLLAAAASAATSASATSSVSPSAGVAPAETEAVAEALPGRPAAVTAGVGGLGTAVAESLGAAALAGGTDAPGDPSQQSVSAGSRPRSARRGWLGRFRSATSTRSVRPGTEGPAAGALSGNGSRRAASSPQLTVVFCHGYCLNQDCWHFQRAAFRDGMRLVFWDQRSHGRSERSRSHLAGEAASIDQLGGDLKAVLDAVAPTGPLVLVGHSMGGMTVMALADQYPELFHRGAPPDGVPGRVAAVALIGTTAGSWSGVTLGLPAYGAKMLHRVAPGVLKALGRQRELVERSRRMGSDLTSVLYRKFSFGTDDVDPAVERFAQRLLEATPIDVVAEFFPAFDLHEKVAALAAFRDLPTLVLGGTRDLLTPPAHSEAIAAELPDAELTIVQDAGHLVMLERPELVNEQLARLLERAAARSGAALPPYVRDLALGTALGQ